MARKGFILLMFLALVNTFSSVTLAQQPAPIIDVLPLNRSSFPRNFVFGTASASYQYEGAANEGGRKPSMWDEYTHKHPERITDGSNGDVAVDQYHRYKEDIHIMKDMNLDAYRFSISWSRILPNGKRSGGINKEGIEYYNHLIDNLLDNGLQPFVTLFHWDIPQTLEEEYGGFLSPLVVADFRDFVEVCFEKFGNRVKHWITLNEPWGYSSKGYANGDFAPGRCSESTCLGGDSGTEPYIVSHYLLLAHAAAVDLYRKKFQDIQKGVIGITLITHYFEPYSNSQADKDASKRALDFMLGWYMDPLTSGKYPESMRSLVGARLPKFFEEQSKLLAGSFDFIGINYYTTYYAANANTNASKINPPSYTTDANVDQLTSRNGVPIGPRYGADWLYIYPKGIRKLLFYIKYTYNNPSIYITENGMAEYDDPTLSIKEMLQDTYRIDYYYRHLYYLLLAIRDDVRVKGYFAWSLLDNFEWKDGYTVRFGLNYVDFNSNFERHAKLSAKWFKAILKKL